MPRSSSPLDRARDAFHKAVNRATVQARQAATVGWRKSATEVLFTVPGRPNFIYVTKSADQTVTVALNRANVPRQPFLPVWVVLENNTLVVVARDNSNAAALAAVPDSDYGVPGHPLSAHDDVTLTSIVDGQLLRWDATAGAWVNVTLDSDDIAEGATNLYATAASVGAIVNAAAAGTPVDADKYGYWDTVNSLFKSITHVNLKALLKTYFDTLYHPKAASGARVYNNAAISLSGVSATVLTFNSERYDTANYHSTSSDTGRLTAPSAGKYLITAQVIFDFNATGSRNLGLRLNGSTFLVFETTQAVTADSAGTGMSIATVYQLAAGDYVEVLANQGSGGALNILAAGSYTPEFTMTRLGD